MKELSIEEKAKRYDEVLKQIKEYTPDENGFITIYLQEIFSELKESDDEKIRKRIIALVNAHGQGMYKNEMLTWLEKQGDKPVNIDIESIVNLYKQRLKSQGVMENTPLVNMCLTSFRRGVEIVLEKLNLNGLEKQGEQKSAEWDILSAKKGDILSNGTIVLIVDSIGESEGKPIINSWYFADSKKFYGKGTSECDRWEVDGFRIATEIECNYLLKMIADAGYEWDVDRLEFNKIEQKPVKWSEEDENLTNMCINIISKSDVKYADYIRKEIIGWLKSLKSRVIPQSKEWNKEDERNINELLFLVEANYLSSEEPHDRLINFLESLKPQNTWKPSEEQLEVLSKALVYVNSNKDCEILSNLYNNLKKII